MEDDIGLTAIGGDGGGKTTMQRINDRPMGLVKLPEFVTAGG